MQTIKHASAKIRGLAPGLAGRHADDVNEALPTRAYARASRHQTSRQAPLAAAIATLRAIYVDSPAVGVCQSWKTNDGGKVRAAGWSRIREEI